MPFSSSLLLPKSVQHTSTVALRTNHEANTGETQTLGGAKLSVLTLKSKDPCIKSQLHLVFLGRSLRKWHPPESVPVHAAETCWQTDWPWRPQPEPAELK